MDYFETCGPDNARKKSKSVRSWYFLEQYTSMKHSQTYAAQKLKNQSYQKTLQRELNERRRRRRLCDDSSVCCQSESYLSQSVADPSCQLSTCSDFFEPFGDFNSDSETELSAEVKSNETKLDQEISDAIKNIDTMENHTENMKNEIEEMKIEIENNITNQLKMVQDNLQAIENYVDVYGYEDSLSNEMENDCASASIRNSVYSCWTRLVSFAYQLMLLNQGNCYYNSGSQISTAVLACDVLRYGLNMICNDLQRYVCPVKLYSEGKNERRLDLKKINKHLKRIKRKTTISKPQKISYAQEDFDIINKNQKTPEKFKKLKCLYCKAAKEKRRQKRFDDGINHTSSPTSVSFEPQTTTGMEAQTSTDIDEAQTSSNGIRISDINPMLKVLKEFDELLELEFDTFCRE